MAEAVDGVAGDQRADRVRDREAEGEPAEIGSTLLRRAVRAEHAVHGDVHVHERHAEQRRREVQGSSLGKAKGKAAAAASTAKETPSGRRGPMRSMRRPALTDSSIGSSAKSDISTPTAPPRRRGRARRASSSSGADEGEVPERVQDDEIGDLQVPGFYFRRTGASVKVCAQRLVQRRGLHRLLKQRPHPGGAELLAVDSVAVAGVEDDRQPRARRRRSRARG